MAVALASDVRRIRGFNRLVAERLGAVDDHFLGRKRPLGESRVLWEVGTAGAEVRELRARLGLDSGYLSRVLRSLGRAGLVLMSASARDRRVRRIDLTPAGRAEVAELDRLSDEVAAGFLAPLDERGRQRLVAAMSEVERLLQASMVAIDAEDPAAADARWCIARYYEELAERFEGGFDTGTITPVDDADLVPPRGAFLVARLRGRPVGCGALKLHGDRPAEIKRMWVDPSARGLGLGRRLLADLEGRARQAGAPGTCLETNRALTEAIRLYRSSGYREVPAFNDEPYGDHWFSKEF